MISAVLTTRFPIRFLSIAVILTGLVLGWLGWKTYTSYRISKLIKEQHFRIQELRGTIAHLDEVLTMSAYMAAATGDRSWEERYHRFEPELDAAIKEIMKLAPEAYSGEAAAQTDVANLRLVEMEEKALTLVRQNRLEEARTILFSENYKSQKRIYAQGMERFASLLKQDTDVALESQHKRAFLNIAIVLVAIPLLLIGWLTVLRYLNQWQLTLAENSRQLDRQANELVELNMILDQKVADRTQKLQQEIFERKRTEQELILERELMNSLMESIPDIIYFKDENCRYIKTNLAHAVKFFFPSPQEMIGKTDFDFYPEYQAWSIFEEDRQILQTDQAVIGKTEKEVWEDGRVTWSLTTKMPLRNKEGKIIGTFGTSKDITALKQAEQALLQAEKKYRSIFENATDGIFQTNIEGRYLSANPALARIYGYESSEDLMTSVTDVARQVYVDPSRRETFAKLIREQNAIWDFESQIYRKDGRIIWISENSRAVRDENGKLLYYEGFVKDITQRKKTEADLEAAHQQIVETSRQAGMAEVATTVLHNVGNVLNSVNVSATLVAETVRKSKLSRLTQAADLMVQHAPDLGNFITMDLKGKQLPDYLKKLAVHLTYEQVSVLQELGSLTKNIEHIKDIVTMQQAYAKVSGVVETVSTAELVDDALRMNAGALSRHDVQIIREYQELPKTSIEKHKLLQILVNLISNAKYAMDEGKLPVKQLTVRIGMNGNNRFKIAVVDNGVGISEENLTRIFSHGFTTKKKGHGFGLHSSALAAKEMGGTISVHSDGPGKGATFVLELPFRPEQCQNG